MSSNKQKARFNFIDALIILIILAVVGAAVYLIAVGGTIELTPSLKGTVNYTVRLSSVEADALPLIRENDTVKDSSTGKVIGTVRSIKTEKAKHYGTTAIPAEKGGYTIAATEYADRYDVYVTVSTEAVKDKNGISRIADIRLLVGSQVNFKVPSFTMVSYIVKVDDFVYAPETNANFHAISEHNFLK